MEELLSYNWNVYKVFSSGKRAKAPFAVVEGEDCDNGDFRAVVRKNLEEKFGGKADIIKYKVLRSDLPQVDELDDMREKFFMLRNKVFSSKIIDLEIDTQNNRTSGALVMSEKTDWKWQWCILRSASNQYIAAVSPQFTSEVDAHEWMISEIEQI